MSAHQERIARKARQRAGEDAFVHLKPQARVLAPVPLVGTPGRPLDPPHPSHRALKQRERRYGTSEVTK